VKFDQNVSINVEGITIGRLLRLWDQATGMNSSIPAELADRTLSINISGLGVNEAVRKIFEKLPFDYVFIQGQGIIVTGISQTGPAEAVPADNPVPQVIGPPSEEELPSRQPPPEPPPPPPMLETPFGPIPKSGLGLIQLPPVPGEVPGPPFFRPPLRLTPPAGAANGPARNNLFGPISIY
jgi:hypothetical protein